MKFAVVFSLALLSGISASPSIYPHVSTQKFQERISDRKMHPAPDHSLYSKAANAKDINPEELTSDYWLNNAKAFVDEQLKKMPNKNKAKNIIMFLGDGMSHPSIAAARVYMGGEEKKLSFEDFPHTASSKTYCVDRQVADSACTATAYLQGIKANYATMGVTAEVLRSDCVESMNKEKHTYSIAAWAMAEGKDAGFVTTTRITHASPGGVYANIADRDWENNEMVEQDCEDSDLVDDIAEQLVYGEVANKLKVMMGGGSRAFYNTTETSHGKPGHRTDGKDLVKEWMDADSKRVFVNDRKGLMALSADVPQVMGLFNSDHIEYNLDIQRDDLQEVMPSLTDMTLKAIEILSKSDNGYFLFSEGGRIDHGHHKNEAKYAIDEAAEFSKAIEATLKVVDLNETLIVVTADHGHVMTLAGYAARHNDIFGFGGNGDDNMPYMTMSYANGLGFYGHKTDAGRVDPSTIDRSANDFRFPTTLPVDSESHGGEDVGIWAIGPWSHLFQGTMEQHAIPHIMAYAACIGDGLRMCD